jgi:hypothetical protein
MKAYAIKPPPPMPEEVEVETVDGHGVVLTKLQDSGPRAWRARVSGDKAVKQCPSKGFKTLFAATEADLKIVVAKWLGDATEADAIE